jgi:arginine N-succinyltransferase
MLPHRFADRVIAEMRGKANPDGSVPFFEAVAGRFIPADFATVDAMSTVSKQFIEEMMPQHPIYLDLLSAEVRAGIGQVHEESAPALAMLQAEGFNVTDFVDIFDGGPMVSCDTSKIRAVQRSCEVSVKRVVDSIEPTAEPLIVASTAGGFASVLAPLIRQGNEVTIGKHEAAALEVEAGSTCVVLPPRQTRP